jgi:hypothetical protein
MSLNVVTAPGVWIQIREQGRGALQAAMVGIWTGARFEFRKILLSISKHTQSAKLTGRPRKQHFPLLQFVGRNQSEAGSCD